MRPKFSRSLPSAEADSDFWLSPPVFQTCHPDAARYNRATVMPLTPGTRLGPYEIAAPLGAGGMGEVYRARDTRLDRIVADQSAARTSFLDTRKLKQRFEREARAISALNHPTFAAFTTSARQDGIDFLVMEFLEGETLAAEVGQRCRWRCQKSFVWGSPSPKRWHSRTARESFTATLNPAISC